MLGKLAKRLRLLGVDVLYDSAHDDNEIIHLSLKQQRVILTRDIALTGRPLASNHLLISSDHIQDQVKQVLAAFPTAALTRPLTRCSRCNDLLTLIRKEDAQDRVPHHVYSTVDDFLQCPRCGRTYWNGTHVMRMSIHGRI